MYCCLTHVAHGGRSSTNGPGLDGKLQARQRCDSHGRSTDRAPPLLREPPLEARAVEDVRAGQPLAAAPDRLLADDALLLPGRFLWRRLRRRARDAGVAAPLGGGAHAARLEAGHFVEGVAALPKLVAHNFPDDVGGRGADRGEGHLRQERHDEHRPRVRLRSSPDVCSWPRLFCSAATTMAMVVRAMAVPSAATTKRGNARPWRSPRSDATHARRARDCPSPRPTTAL